MTEDLLLSMQGIGKRFGASVALSDASFAVRRGEVHALIGQNGAGKSTLIKILTGYHRRDAGAVTFDGAPFEASSPHDAQARGVSTIYQEINLVPTRSLTENILLGRERRRRGVLGGLLDWRAMHEEARALLRRFQVEADVRRPLMEFSTATQQMVAIARAVGFAAKLVVMDEPTSSLDEREVAVLFDVIRGLKAAGVSVVFVSHKLDELFAVCDRVTVMRDGRTVLVSEMGAVGKLDLVSAMLGRRVAEGHATAFRDHAPPREGPPMFSAARLAAGRAVRDVSFGLHEGEIVGLAGLLGSGRTETARLAFGADPADSGAMTLDGRPYAPASPRDAIAAGIGFCSEDRKVEGIVPDMSVAENMMLAVMPRLATRGVVPDAEMRRRVEVLIKALGVKCSGPDQKIRELSGGNQQKVLLGRWLATDPRILILDEPTRGIDVGAKAEIQALIRALADKGLGVLMISSELEDILEGADRVIVLREGVAVAALPKALATEDAVMAAMAHGDAPGSAAGSAPGDAPPVAAGGGAGNAPGTAGSGAGAEGRA